MKFTVDFVDFKRTILCGMKKERNNPKAEVEGKQALFVVNLKPRKMFGIESHGVLFDIGYDDGIVPVWQYLKKKLKMVQELADVKKGCWRQRLKYR